MSSICSASDTEEWVARVATVFETPSLPHVLDPIFSATDSASDLHLHDTNGSFWEGIAHPSLNVLGLPPPFKDLSWEDHSVTSDLSLFSINDDKARGVHFKDRFQNHEERTKRTRSPNWSREEKQHYLELKEEALGVVVGKPDWDFISRNLWDRHKFVRSSKVCEDLWGTLLKAYRAIRGHESSKSGAQTGNWVSYWEMGEDERSKKKLPRSFFLEWCKMIERILAAQEKRPRSTDPAETSHAKFSGREGSGAILEEGDQFVKPLVPFIKQQVEEKVNSALQSLPCRKNLGATTERDGLMTSIAPFVKRQVETAVIYALQLLALTGFIFDEDDPITRLAPFIGEYIKDALNSALQPVSSALQAFAQKEQEDQERLRALEEEKRAVDREIMQIKRQRFGRHHGTRRTSCKQQVPRVKNPSAVAVIPALKELRIARDQDQVTLLEDE